LRGVFFEPGITRTRGGTEKTSDKFMASEDMTLVHFLYCGSNLTI